VLMIKIIILIIFLSKKKIKKEKKREGMIMQGTYGLDKKKKGLDWNFQI
jgi:Ca2+/Na+ antiporter